MKKIYKTNYEHKSAQSIRSAFAHSGLQQYWTTLMIIYFLLRIQENSKETKKLMVFNLKKYVIYK